MERDMDANPYDAQERRVCDYLTSLADMGCGDDPVGWLIASHNEFARRNGWVRHILAELRTHINLVGPVEKFATLYAALEGFDSLDPPPKPEENQNKAALDALATFRSALDAFDKANKKAPS